MALLVASLVARTVALRREGLDVQPCRFLLLIQDLLLKLPPCLLG